MYFVDDMENGCLGTSNKWEYIAAKSYTLLYYHSLYFLFTPSPSHHCIVPEV